MVYHVFISYSTKDLATVQRVDTLLDGTDVEVFFADRSVEPGQSIAARIRDGIKRCDLFILLWSKNCEDSDWLRDEVGQARAHAKPIIPVRLDQDSALPEYLRDVKYLDARDDSESALVKLRETVFARADAKADLHKQQLFWVSIVVGLLLLGGK